MNFQDLMSKLRTIDEGTVAECGDMGPTAPKQPDNVTMNVTINGSGKGGIRDLMDILKDIESGKEPHDAHALFGEPHSDHEKEEPIMGDCVDQIASEENEIAMPAEEEVIASEEWENAAPGDEGPETKGVDAVLPTGNDLFANAGDNRQRKYDLPTARPVKESLVNRLSEMYKEVKTRGLKESVLTDHTRHTLHHIIKTHERDFRDFQQTGEMSDDLYHALYDYYFEDMPYGVKKARTGDPEAWIADRLHDDGVLDEVYR